MTVRYSLSSTYSPSGGPVIVKVWKNREKGDPKSGEVIIETEVPAKFGFNYLRQNNQSDSYLYIEHVLENEHDFNPDLVWQLIRFGSVHV